MRRNYRKSGLVALLLSVSSVSFADEVFKVDCPKTIQVDERVVSKHPTWERISDNGYGEFGHRLERVSFYNTQPSQLGKMSPDNRTLPSTKEVIDTWELPNNGKQAHWVACIYSGTLQMLVRRLPPHVKSCDISSSLTTYPGALPKIDKIEAVVCR